MDYLAKAMSLFENGVPSHKDYEDAILKPRKDLSAVETRVNASAIDAVGYYISAYEGLKKGMVNRAYQILVIDQCFAEDLPTPLTTNTLKRMYEEFLDNLPIKDVATIEAVLANEFAHAKQVMTDLVKRLNEHDLRLRFDDNYHEIGISVEHNKTGRLLYDTLKDV